MKKRNYEKPSMKVHVLKQRPQLLQASVTKRGQLNDPNDYHDGGDPFQF